MVNCQCLPHIHVVHVTTRVLLALGPSKLVNIFRDLINDGLFLPILSKSETIPYLQQVSIDPYLQRQLTIPSLSETSR